MQDWERRDMKFRDCILSATMRPFADGASIALILASAPRLESAQAYLRKLWRIQRVEYGKVFEK